MVKHRDFTSTGMSRWPRDYFDNWPVWVITRMDFFSSMLVMWSRQPRAIRHRQQGDRDRGGPRTCALGFARSFQMIRHVGKSVRVLFGRTMACTDLVCQRAGEVIHTHIVGSLTIPRASIKWV